MTTISTVANFLFTAGEFAFPGATPFIEFARRAEPFIEAGIPLLKAGLAEGPAAYAAAKAKAPDFFAQLQILADKTKARMTGDVAAVASDHEVAALSAHIVGVDPPGWTHEETQRWWDIAQGNQGS